MSKKYELLKDDYINHEGRTLYRIRALKDFGNVKAGDIGGYIQSEENLSHEEDCWIYDDAKVFDNAVIYDNAIIARYAHIHGDATIRGDAIILDNAKITGHAEVYGDAIVRGNAEILDYAKVHGNALIFGSALVLNNAEIYGDAEVCGNTEVYGNAEVCGNAEVYGNANINKGTIIGEVSMPYKDIFQYQCEHRLLTAILTKNDKILYTIGCQSNMTEEEFINRIHNHNGDLYSNPHRAEYLRLIKIINIYFKGE